MTTFTPPTEFPHECLSVSGEKVTLLAVDITGIYACVWHSEDGSIFADVRGPSNLRDIPKVTSTWQNVYANGRDAGQFNDRKSADTIAANTRIAVLRRDTIDGVTTCTLEDV